MSGEPDEWDLVIVGAGPAGASAALAALTERPGTRVLLLDREDFPRDKSCGDGIAPHVIDVLRPLGADHVVDGWTPLEHLDLSTGDHHVLGRMARPVHVVPREIFDARLVECAVHAGATLRRHRVRRLEETDTGVVIDGRLRARLVVGADGAQSAVRGALGLGHPSRRALAIRGYARTADARRGRQVIHYGDRRQPSYAWAFDRGDGWSNVGYGELVGRGAPPSRALLLKQLERLLPGSLDGATRWRGHHLPLSGWRWGREQPPGRVLLAGDAAGLINPMTGEGIYYAVATGSVAGREAVRSVAEGRPETAGDRHRHAVRHLLDRHLHHTWTAARLSRSPAVVAAGIRAARSHQRHFDDLVELGLGDGRITPGLAVGLAAGLAAGLVRQG